MRCALCLTSNQEPATREQNLNPEPETIMDDPTIEINDHETILRKAEPGGNG